MTIGLDLDDRSSCYCVLEESGRIMLEQKVSTTANPEVERIATVLHDRYKVERVAPGHCTGEPDFAALKRVFGDH